MGHKSSIWGSVVANSEVTRISVKSRQLGKGSRIFVGKTSTFANSMVALRKKFQLNGTNLLLEGRLLAGHAPSHLLRESNHKR